MAFRGAAFADVDGTSKWNTYTTYGLYFKKGTPRINAPEVQTEYVEVPGRDGNLDLSQAVDGEVHYKDRTVEIELVAVNPEATIGTVTDWQSLFSSIRTRLHGQRVVCILDEFPNYYFVGRWTVECTISSNKKAYITITGDCEPYMVNINDSSDKRL